MELKVAIIPARAGSKRLPGKNVKMLAGKPMIAWTIESALNSQCFDSVIVSTDSQQIAEIAIAAGADVPYLRPAELATDTATTDNVIADVVQFLEKTKKIKTVCLLQPTSPLRGAMHIKEAMERYRSTQAEAIVSVCEVDHPLQLCNYLPEDQSLNGFFSAQYGTRSQDMPKAYRINGAIYIFDRKYVGKLLDIYKSKSFAYVMDKKSSVDIDDIVDFTFAEALLHS